MVWALPRERKPRFSEQLALENAAQRSAGSSTRGHTRGWDHVMLGLWGQGHETGSDAAGSWGLPRSMW